MLGLSFLKNLFTSYRLDADLNDPAAWTPSGSDGNSETSAGINVTQGKSFKSSPYYACINSISADLASLPIELFKTIPNGGREKRPTHPVSKLINRAPNSRMTAYSFWQAIVQYVLGWGNGVAEIETDFSGKVLRLSPIEPWRMEFKVLKGSGDLIYVIHPEAETNQEIRVLSQDQVLHFKGLGNGSLGYSVLQFQGESLGRSLQTQSFATTFFSQGAHAGHIVTSKRELGTVGKDNLEKNLARFRHQSNWNKVMFLREGVELNTMPLPLKDSQFIEQMEFSVEDIARWFRMPLRMLQSGKTTGEIEAQQVDVYYAKYTLCPWAVMIEQELERKLLPTSMSLSLKHDFNEILRADQKSRAEYYKSLFVAASIRPNDIMRKEGLDPVGPEGELTYAQINIAPLEMLKELAEKAIEPPPPPPPPAVPESEPEPEEQPEDTGEDFVSKIIPLASELCNDLAHRFCSTRDKIISGKSTVGDKEEKLLKLAQGFPQWADQKLYSLFQICGKSDNCKTAIVEFMNAYHRAGNNEFDFYKILRSTVFKYLRGQQ